jgi:ferredoxin--NADP+ reductase
MSEVGSASNPLRVAIIGSGPAGFYTVSNFLKHKDLNVEIDMFDRLPTPFGLVRGGVAPDHQKDKSVTRAYDKSAQQPNFRFYGNVEYGKHFTMEDVKRHYHQIVFCTGAQVDRSLGVPGEDLEGSHSATDFVAWYNGHPDFAHLEFDLSAESVAVVGIGNVAVDVARMLCHTHEELLKTDMANYAIEALKNSNVKTVYMLGRRGPAQAAFTPPEIKEFAELAGADVIISKEDAALDPESQKDMEASDDKNVAKNVETIQELAGRSPEGKQKQLHIRFLVSPTEVVGDENDHVKALKLVKNELYRDDDGSLRSRSTDEVEELPVQLVFRSVGYRGVALPEVPFKESWGSVPNEKGRVTTEEGDQVTGLYCAGWIKRGPSGVIGTNKPDAQETVNCMVEDIAAGNCFQPEAPDVGAMKALLEERQPEAVSYEDWLKIDQAEQAAGEEVHRPRVKFTSVEDMLSLLK